jgi:hypothetical protein
MIKHTIRAKDGGAKIVSLTPLKAIRVNCLECVCWSAYEVKNCTSKLCALYPYRFGKVPGHKGKGNVHNLIEK